MDGRSELGDFHYVPVLFREAEKLTLQTWNVEGRPMKKGGEHVRPQSHLSIKQLGCVAAQPRRRA
jgi:hypothetical protein